MEEKKTWWTMEELDERIKEAMADGEFKEYVPTQKEIEAARRLVAAIDEKNPDIKAFYEEDPDGCHFCRSVEAPLEWRKRYMMYAHAKENVLYADK